MRRAPRSPHARPWTGSIWRRVVSTREPYAFGNPAAPHHIVAYDYGIKRNILRLFDEQRLSGHRRARNDAG